MIHIVPTLQDNYTYIVEKDSEALIIDCGEAVPVLNFLHDNHLQPSALFCTHHHGDHIDGIDELLSKWPDMKIYASAKDRYRIPAADNDLQDGQVFTWNGIDFLPIETPGHTKHHLCFHTKDLNAVFTGDTLFSMGCGRLFEGTPEDMFSSLARLKNLPGDTQIYGGHEYTLKNGEFSLSIQRNPDIERRIENVKSALSQGKASLPVSLETENTTNLFLKAETVEEFARLRELRNHF